MVERFGGGVEEKGEEAVAVRGRGELRRSARVVTVTFASSIVSR